MVKSIENVPIVKIVFWKVLSTRNEIAVTISIHHLLNVKQPISMLDGNVRMASAYKRSFYVITRRIAMTNPMKRLGVTCFQNHNVNLGLDYGM